MRGKRSKGDVQLFARNLMSNIHNLHEELVRGAYRHGGYVHFRIADPKPRDIHKAAVRDRLLHHAIYRQLYPFYDSVFIADSYSCRKEKGTHKARARFRQMGNRVSQNNTRTCWVLKCDIRKFFASIDHGILLRILRERIQDQQILALLQNVIDSFEFNRTGVGLPLGNLTSQLFVNIYMNEFDQFVKHKLRMRNYIRYADDFVFLSRSRSELDNTIPAAQHLLLDVLSLRLHPKKTRIQTFASGVDFLGWVHFPQYTVLRTTSKKRMFRRIAERPTNDVLESYRGLLSHGNAHPLKGELENIHWLLSDE